MDSMTDSAPPPPAGLGTKWRRLLARLPTNPVMAKELRGAMRGIRAPLILTVYLLILGGMASLSFIPLASVGPMSGGVEMLQAVGKGIFSVVTIVQMFAVSLLAPALTVGAIAGERERQTYDILRTTLLPARALVVGKLVAALAFLLLIVVAALPVLSLAFLFGGVALEEVVIAGLMIAMSAVAFSAVGVFFSSLMKRTLAATVLAYGVTIFLMIGLPMLIVMLLSFLGPVLYPLFSGTAPPSALSPLVMLTWLMVIANPLSAGLVSEAILVEQQSIWGLPLPLGSGSLWIPSPWIGNVIAYALLSAVLIAVSIRRIRRPEV